MKSFIAPALLAAAAVGQTTKYTASLGGGFGTVEWIVNDGTVGGRGVSTMIVTYNTTGQDSTACPDGFNYHVHELWQDTQNTQDVGAQCGSDNTGGHYVPNRMCDSISFPGAECVMTDGRGIITTCEVGDLAGRFGALPVNSEGTMTYTDYWSDPSMFEDRSVVVHCGSPRVSCGKIIAAAAPDSVVGAGGATLVADFAAWGMVTLNGDSGSVNVQLTIPTENASQYGEGYQFSYHIHEKWENDDDVAVLADCGAAFTGGHWDPMWACGPASQYNQNANCLDCLAANATYSCTPTSDPYACEVGDLSGRFGALTVAADGTLSYDGAAGQLFLNDMAAGTNTLSIVIHGAGGARIACAKLAAPSSTSSVAAFAPSVLLVAFLAQFF
jgi:Cu/Zn superoxide dismutase